MLRPRFTSLCKSLIILGASIAPVSAAADYSFTTFDVPGSLSTTIEGVNNVGLAVGTYTTSTTLGLPPSHGFILRPDGFATTYDVPNSQYTYGKGISNDGTVVGYYVSATDPTAYHGYLRDTSGKYNYFDVANSSSTRINGLNSSGQSVGSYTDAIGTHGFVRSADGKTVQTINVAGSISTEVTGINSSGFLVGYYAAVNLFGQIAYHGFVRSPDGIDHSLDSSLPFSTQTFAEGINDLGQVGGNTIEFGVFSVGFVLNPDYSLQSIVAAPNGLTTVVEGINNCGQLVGNYTDYTLVTHGFITPNLCPEPGSLIMASVGLLSVAAFRWISHRGPKRGRQSESAIASE